MGFKLEGLDEFQRELEKLSSRAEKLDGNKKVSLHDLFSPDFIRTFSDFLNLDEMFEAFGQTPKTTEECDALTATEAWNSFVADRTLFDSWEAMRDKAVERWATKKLGLE